MFKKTKKWIKRLTAGLLFAVCALVATVFLLVQTEAGMTKISEMLSRGLSADDQQIRVIRISDLSLTHIGAGSLLVSDTEGVWLEVSDVRLDWSLKGLLAGRICLSQVHVGLLDILRLPNAGGGKTAQGNVMPAVPEFTAGNIRLDQLRMADGICGVPVVVLGTCGSLHGGSSNGAIVLNIKASADGLSVSNSVMERVDADIGLTLRSAGWGLTNITVHSAGLRISGGLDFADVSDWPAGELSIEADGNTRWAKSLLPGLSDGKVKMSLAGELLQDGMEMLKAELTSCGLKGEGLTVGDASVRVQLSSRREAGSDILVDAAADIRNISAGALVVTGAVLHISGPLHAVDVAGTAGGSLGKPFSADVAGQIQWNKDRQGFDLARATLKWADIQAGLVEPLIVDHYRGQTEISAAWRTDMFELASVSNAVLGRLAGRLSAGLRVSGTLAEPKFNGDMTCEGLSAKVGYFTEVPAVSGNFSLSYSNDLVCASAQASLSTGGMAKAEMQIPLKMSLWPWVLQMEPDREMPISLEANLDLGVLNGLEAFSNGRIGGRLDLSLAHGGSVSNRSVTGTCVLTGGAYENSISGTVIRNAVVKLVAHDDMLLVESGSATDGGKGRMTLSGNMRLAPTEGFPYAFKVGCSNARLVNRPDAEASLSGKLNVSGNVSSINAEGEVRLDEVLVKLQNLRAVPASLETAHGGKTNAVGVVRGNTNITLRLAVAIPGNLYIRGRTIDSAWAGDMVFGYAGGVPYLSGYIEPRRGTMLILKRPFKLAEGRIEFDGSWPPIPALRITAVCSRADINASVHIVGNANNPEVTLTSVPSLPEDEIIARILFGKDMSTITPLQALSLASEATKLRKISGGGGIMDDVQSAIGVDRVEFREAGEGNTSPEVAAGKYLGDRTYVEMRRTTSREQSGRSRLYLEQELRPNIVLEAESGIEMRSGVGVFWKKDY